MKNQLLIILSFLFTTLLVAQISPKEKQALIDLYLATNGENWVNTWDLNTPVEEWHGITIENDYVTDISLLFNNLTGTLPVSIGDFNNLRVLELSFNKLIGKIPMEIGRLTKLEHLALNGNNMNGNIPSSIGDLVLIKELHLSSNSFQGMIPTSVNNLMKLEILNVFDNNLSGTIPLGLTHSKSLKQLVIAQNDLIKTEAYSSLLLFKNDQNNSLKPVTKTIIASETSDDN